MTLLISPTAPLQTVETREAASRFSGTAATRRRGSGVFASRGSTGHRGEVDVRGARASSVRTYPMRRKIPTVNVAVAVTGPNHPPDEPGFQVRDLGPHAGDLRALLGDVGRAAARPPRAPSPAPRLQSVFHNAQPVFQGCGFMAHRKARLLDPAGSRQLPYEPKAGPGLAVPGVTYRRRGMWINLKKAPGVSYIPTAAYRKMGLSDARRISGRTHLSTRPGRRAADRRLSDLAGVMADELPDKVAYKPAMDHQREQTVSSRPPRSAAPCSCCTRTPSLCASTPNRARACCRCSIASTSSDLIISARGQGGHGQRSSHRFICLTPPWPRGVSFPCRVTRGSHGTVGVELGLFGSIPACAGKPY